MNMNYRHPDKLIIQIIPGYFDRLLRAKLPEPGGGCNLERSRMRRAID
jgi:hypothetical protein